VTARLVPGEINSIELLDVGVNRVVRPETAETVLDTTVCP
jgi:hypothetical protein